MPVGCIIFASWIGVSITLFLAWTIGHAAKCYLHGESEHIWKQFANTGEVEIGVLVIVLWPLFLIGLSIYFAVRAIGWCLELIGKAIATTIKSRRGSSEPVDDSP